MKDAITKILTTVISAGIIAIFSILWGLKSDFVKFDTRLSAIEAKLGISQIAGANSKK